MTTEFLDALEDRIQRAAEQIGSLREANRDLGQRVAELEGELATARADGGGDWPAERAELERRVAALVERLEELLES